LKLEKDNLPLDDTEREHVRDLVSENKEVPPELAKRPKFFDFEFEHKYGGWIPDLRLDVIEGKSGHNLDLSCHDRCLVSSPQLFLNHDDPDGENYLEKSEIVSKICKIWCLIIYIRKIHWENADSQEMQL